MSLAMTRAEREAFVADTHVAVLSVADEGRAPLTIPVWYRYAPGGRIRFATGGGSRKAALIRKAGRVSLCVQTEVPPYQYVTVEGRAAILAGADVEPDTREMALRYLGPQVGEAYLALTAEERAGSVLVEVTPERWLSADFRKMTMA
jgi:PPOX class probable F420-dependent enzyme